MTTFFDSHGGLWTACAATDDGAVAFGPTGVARPAHPAEHGLFGEGTAFSMARRAGRVISAKAPHEWDLLAPEEDEATCRLQAAAYHGPLAVLTAAARLDRDGLTPFPGCVGQLEVIRAAAAKTCGSQHTTMAQAAEMVLCPDAVSAGHVPGLGDASAEVEP